MPDAAGCADEIEKIISQIKGVQSIETIEMSLL
jgi:translation elongation factor EF-1beta